MNFRGNLNGHWKKWVTSAQQKPNSSKWVSLQRKKLPQLHSVKSLGNEAARVLGYTSVSPKPTKIALVSEVSSSRSYLMTIYFHEKANLEVANGRQCDCPARVYSTAENLAASTEQIEKP